MEITKDIRYVGVDDHDIDLFEGQYDVSENGMAYNSYVILGEKIAVADSVDGGFVDEWLGNIEAVLEDIVQHLPCPQGDPNAAGANPGAGAQGGNQPGDDGVVDADYEEV